MEGTRVDQRELERLLELDRKFAQEGLTFDDVLLVPAESSVLPNEVSTRILATQQELDQEFPEWVDLQQRFWTLLYTAYSEVRACST